MNFKSSFLQISAAIWLQVILFVLFLSVARFIFLITFGDLNLILNHPNDIFKTFKVGALFDLRVSSISLFALYLIGIFACLSQQIFKLFQKIFPLFASVIGFIFCFSVICSYYYFQTYGNNFDIFIFEIKDEDLNAVFKTVWQEYPIIISLIASFLFSFISYKLASKNYCPKHKAVKNNFIFLLLALFLVFIFLLSTRGSLGTFPLRKSNAQVSSIDFFNKITPNAFMFLDWAYADYKQNSGFKAVDFKQGVNYLKDIFDEENLTTNTKTNIYLEKNKPNVVLAIMESMGTNFLNFDRYPENDLLGNLRNHFNDDFLFYRFISSDNGTKPSLAALLFNSPYPNISHSYERKTKIKGSAFEPYQKAGYKTIFISAGNMMWHNMSNFLIAQDVEVIDENALMSTYPESVDEKTDWGVPDEYAFKFAYKLLKNTNEPLFIVILSITNHPPFVVPSTYQPKNTTVPAEYSSKLNEDLSQSRNTFEVFQYSADSLGNFISEIKNSDLVNHTIISATADHRFRRVPSNFPSEIMLDKAVPFYLYLPQIIQNKVGVFYDKNKVGSHKDIMPTLFSYSLSNAKYYNLGGRNMLSKTDQPNKEFGFNSRLWMDDKGVYPFASEYFLYKWVNEDSLLVEPTNQVAEKSISEKINKFRKFNNWQINYRIKGTK